MLEINRPSTGSKPKEIRAPADPGDVAFIAGVASRQRGLVGFMTLIGIMIGVLIYMLAPPVYKATSVVLIDFKRLAAVDENFSTGSGRIDSSAVLSQLELLTSESVSRRVVLAQKLDKDPEFGGKQNILTAIGQKLGLATPEPDNASSPERLRRAIEAVQKAVTGERVDLSYTIAVTFKASTAEKAARLANALAQAYIDDQLEAKRLASQKASEWFKQRIADLRNEVSTADMKVVEFRRANNIVTNDGKFIDEQQISDLSQKLLQAQYARSAAEAKAAALKKLVESGQATGALADEFSNEVVIDLRNKLLDANRRATDLAQRYGEDHKTVTDLKAKMAEIQNAINEQYKRIYEAAKTDFAISDTQVATMQKELADLSAKTNDSREARAQLANLESNADAVKSIYDTFMSRYVDGIQKESFPMTEARIISEAEVPLSPNFPTGFKTIGAGAAIGFGLGFLAAVAREGFTRHIRFSRQVRQATNNTFLGYLPKLSMFQVSKLGSEKQISRLPTLYIETLRHVKINLDLERSGSTAVCAFVSTAPGEGTSLTAANFAALCATGGWRTLLIDLNLRNQTISGQNKTDMLGGVVEILAGTNKPSELIIPTSNPNLHLLAGASKSVMSSPADLLLSPQFQQMISLLSSQYRYIIIDTPALGVVADANAIAAVADAFVMVAEWNETEQHVLSEVLKNNRTVDEKLLGTVLNKANIHKLVQIGELHPRSV